MKIINASYEIINKEKINSVEILKEIEIVGRTCYKSESNITEDSAKNFVKMLIDRGHEAMIEHNSISVRFICDRGVSHELVRHRLASFGQESTRYCNYANDKFGSELTFIQPEWFEYVISLYTPENFKDHLEWFNPLELDWIQQMHAAEDCYLRLLEGGWQPQQARSVLPNSIKTEIVMTMNIREWRHFFKLRCDTPAHPQMRELTLPLLYEMQQLIPIVFDDIVEAIQKGITPGSQDKVQLAKYKKKVHELSAELIGLRKESNFLNELEARGVDNWLGYSDAYSAAYGEDD